MRGNSAGGLTVLSSLAFFDTFKAGVSYSGISDMEVLSQDSHKFVSKYLEHLVGISTEEQNIYRERSPLYHLEELDEPLLLIQGEDDALVAQKQSMTVFNALKAKGVPVAYQEFNGEKHGLKDPQNKIKALEVELAFYGKVFGFTPAGEQAPLYLENARNLKHDK